MAYQEPRPPTRTQVHANALGLQRSGWATGVHADPRRKDTTWPRRGAPRSPDLTTRVRGGRSGARPHTRLLQGPEAREGGGPRRFRGAQGRGHRWVALAGQGDTVAAVRSHATASARFVNAFNESLRSRFANNRNI